MIGPIGKHIDVRQRRLLYALRVAGRATRSELQRQTGLRPNTLGEDATLLTRMGLLRSCPAHTLRSSSGAGRPAAPLEINPEVEVVGISVKPERLEAAVLNLRGQSIGSVISKPVPAAGAIGRLAAELAAICVGPRTAAIGLSTTGKFDPRRRVLLGSWLPTWKEICLQPLYRAVGHRPVLLANDMQALVGRWLLERQPDPRQDVLLLSLDDGNVGGAILVQRADNHAGADVAASAGPCSVHDYVSVHNEIGHTRLPVQTEPCYCGRRGCLTRICSSAFLQALDPTAPLLAEAAAAYTGGSEPVGRILEYLAMAIGNIANTVCADRIVLVSPLVQPHVFSGRLLRAIHRELHFDRSRHLVIETWNAPTFHPGQTAAWLALKGLYVSGFGPTERVA